jgi:hypothetical protein
MTGGKSALWVDEDIADVITGMAVKFIEDNKKNSFSCTLQRMIFTFQEFLTSDLQAGADGPREMPF